MSGFQLREPRRSGRRFTVAVCVVALLAGTLATDAAMPAQGAAAPAADAAAKKKKKKKRCKKGYKQVTVKVKRKKRGKRVVVKVKKCRKAKKKAKKKATPAPAPGPQSPAPGPTPGPAPAGPKIDQILGWSTLAQDPDTPPADLVANGGTITNCTTTNSLSVYIRRSGVTAVGQLTHTWKRNGAVIASGTNSSTYNGAFRYGITISPINGLYELAWSVGGATLGTASITRSC